MKLRELAHRAMDGLRDRADSVVTALGGDVISPAIPERVRELGSGPGADLLGGLTVVEGFEEGGLTIPAKEFIHTGFPLLDSFFFRYTGDEHHLNTILIFPDSEPGRMLLSFKDRNADDEYYFKVVHRLVSDSRIQRFQRSLDICGSGRCTVPLSKPAGDFVFVLIGFQLSFTGGRDHQINEVRILESNGSLDVRFNDRNRDDNFIWDVKFAYVPRDLFARIGTSAGNGDRGGASRADVPAGPSVIRGFSFDFVTGDHPLRDIGVTTPDDGRVEVFYEDNNQDDAFNWVVEWGVLST